MKTIALTLAVMGLSITSALAAERPAPPERPAERGNCIPFPQCLGGLPPTPSGDGGMTGTMGPIGQIAGIFASDVKAAEALAISIPDLQDGNGAACWTAGADLAAVVKAHPDPLTGRGLTDLEAMRLSMAATEKICSNPACNQVFAELANGVAQMGLISLPVPSLSSLCAKVPHVSMVAPPAPVAPVPPASAPEGGK